MTIWSQVASLIPKIIDASKSLFIFLYIRKSTKTKIHYDDLKKQSKIRKKQLEIAVRPNRSWNDILKRMRDNKL